MVSGRPGDHRRCGWEPEFGPARMEGMDANKLFEMALGAGNGWRVVKSEMDVAVATADEIAIRTGPSGRVGPFLR